MADGIRKMTKQEVRMLRSDLNGALMNVAAKHDLNIELGSARFSDTQVTFHLKVIVKDAITGESCTRERQAFKAYANMYGLDCNWLNQTYTMGDQTFRIIGLNTRAQRYPVIVIRESDQVKFKIDTDSIIHLMKR